jgi:esterase/lipase superfamily enzyme
MQPIRPLPERPVIMATVRSSLATLCVALLAGCTPTSSSTSDTAGVQPPVAAAPAGTTVTPDTVPTAAIDTVAMAPQDTNTEPPAQARGDVDSITVHRIDSVTALHPDTVVRHARRARTSRARPAGEGHGDSTAVVLIPVYYATSRARTGHAPPNGVFGGDREHGPLHYGVATISIPPGHRPGELERPGRILFIIHRSEDPAKHVVIARLDTLDADGWLRRVQRNVDSTQEKEILVYVHGYNVPFDDAMRRAGQLGYDLGYENGTVAAFSWPSRGSAAEYAADAANAEWTGPALERFLTRLADSAGAQRIAVVVHSMGNRAMASVLRSLATRAQPAFTELVLAAPDLDADVFQEQIAPILGKAARHSTLYVSSGDRALGISTRLHEQLRAGLGGARMFDLQDLDVVDASSVPAGALDHSYYAENKEVIDDIFMLVRRGLRPEQRNLRKYPQYHHAWRLP